MADYDQDSFDTMVKLNVGGTWHTTTRGTLTSQPSEVFHSLLQEGEKGAKIQNGESGYYFIDRDGSLFRHVLNFLRTGELNLPFDFNEYDLLQSEANFFGLTKLENAIMVKKSVNMKCDHIEVIEVAHPEKVGLCCTRLVLTENLQEEAPFCDVINPGGSEHEMYEGQRGRFWVRTNLTRVEWAEKLPQYGWNMKYVTSFCRKIPDITGTGTDICHIVERWYKGMK